jgi:uncharacterized membrane protein YcaP (DUF421 family)
VVLFFILTISVIRIMGKAALAQLAPHDLAAIVFLVTIAVNPILTDKVGQSIVGLVVVASIHMLLSRLTLVRKLNQWILGEPTILIRHGKLIKVNLKRSRYSLVEVLGSLRKAGYPYIHEVEYAILEPTGDISILPKKDVVPVTPRHLNLEVDNPGLPLSVVVEGRIQYKNLDIIKKDKKWLKKQLEDLGITDLQDIFHATVNEEDHSLTIDTGEGKIIR